MYKLYLFLYCILGAAVYKNSVMSSFQSVHLFKGIEGVVNGMIMFYVLGMFWAECKQCERLLLSDVELHGHHHVGIVYCWLLHEGVIYTKTNGYFADNQLIHIEVLNRDDFNRLWMSSEKSKQASKEADHDSEIRDSVLLKVIEVVGYVLYGVYILDAVVVLINLFIAMMNLKTFRMPKRLVS